MVKTAVLACLLGEFVANGQFEPFVPISPSGSAIIKGMVEEYLIPEISAAAILGWTAKKLGKAFTHYRSIAVRINMPPGTPKKFKYSGYYQDGNKVKFAFESTSTALAVLFFNDGSMSGCMEFIEEDCHGMLYVCASNPLVGQNKVRVAYLDSRERPTTCQKEYAKIDGFGDAEGFASVTDFWCTYDNPSSIDYNLINGIDGCSPGSVRVQRNESYPELQARSGSCPAHPSTLHCGNVPRGMCMTGCDPHLFQPGDGIHSRNQCACNWQGTECKDDPDRHGHFPPSGCHCGAVPYGKCMTGCDPHLFQPGDGINSRNKCACNYQGTECKDDPDRHGFECPIVPTFSFSNHSVVV